MLTEQGFRGYKSIASAAAPFRNPSSQTGGHVIDFNGQVGGRPAQPA